MRLLFIKPKQIGDSLILTPTLTAVKQAYPGAEISVLIREGCEGIMAGCPAIDRVLTIAPVERRERKKLQWLRDAKTLLTLRKSRFDYVFELGDGHRGRWFSLLCRRAKCYSVKPATPLNHFWRSRFDGVSNRDWEKIHRVEKDYLAVHEFLPLPLPIPPMVFEKSKTVPWQPAAHLDSFVVLNVGTRQKWNRWDRESWLKVGRRLLEIVPHLVITCGPVEREVADSAWLQERLGDRVLTTLGKTSWAELAGLFYRARLLVCPNTAAMHLGAACGCPTVAMFGPTSEVHWRPWLVPHRIVTSSSWRPGVDDPNDFQKIGARSMKDVSAENVIAACEELLAEPSRDAVPGRQRG